MVSEEFAGALPGAEVETSSENTGVVKLVCRPEAPLRVLLCGHYDTVYGEDHPFQQCAKPDGDLLRGPGVADMKGGLAVMLEALSAFERFPERESAGWTVMITADEEIGSPVSAPLLEEAARDSHIGLVFEPALSGGMLARARPGSAELVARVRGRAAHAGRNFADGRSAIAALCDAVNRLQSLNRREPAGATVIWNAGRIDGGGPVNVVPDRAEAAFNLRIRRWEDGPLVEKQRDEITRAVAAAHGVELDWTGGFSRLPKEITPEIGALFASFGDCARTLGFDLQWRDTDGCCDGNNLAAAGLPNLDSLGPRGGKIHSSEEYLEIGSLVERAQLSALFLMALADGAWEWPAGN